MKRPTQVVQPIRMQQNRIVTHRVQREREREIRVENKMDVGFKFHRLTTSVVVGFFVGCCRLLAASLAARNHHLRDGKFHVSCRPSSISCIRRCNSIDRILVQIVVYRRPWSLLGPAFHSFLHHF